jgi:hypothetical protein
MLSVSFEFEDSGERAQVDRNALLQVLSTGEKKALYVLNIIFEVEARKKLLQPTLFVVDDIADSFDYKNKYAIIEYLMEISEVTCFRQLILTHNFDFFRTIESRFGPYNNCLMATKSAASTRRFVLRACQGNTRRIAPSPIENLRTTAKTQQRFIVRIINVLEGYNKR